MIIEAERTLSTKMTIMSSNDVNPFPLLHAEYPFPSIIFLYSTRHFLPTLSCLWVWQQVLSGLLRNLPGCLFPYLLEVSRNTHWCASDVPTKVFKKFFLVLDLVSRILQPVYGDLVIYHYVYLKAQRFSNYLFSVAITQSGNLVYT